MATDSQDLPSPAPKKPKADENCEKVVEKQDSAATQASDGKLQVTLLSENAKLPTKGSAQAAGYDLYAAYDMVIPAKGRALVKTDIQVKVPAGTYGRVAPRSGLAVKEGIDVGAGVIDADYRGPVGVLLFNFNDADFKVSAGERIAQLICEKIANVDIEQVSKLDDTERGDGGFGSTGTA